MSRRGENIYKRKDGRWEGRYFKENTENGVKKYGFIYGKTYHEVKEKVESAKAAVKLAKAEQQEKLHSFSFFANEWLIKIKPFVKESTFVRYRNLLNHHILPQFGSFCITELKENDVEDYRNFLLCGAETGNCLSPKYVADILSVIKMVQKYAVMKDSELSLKIHEVSVKRKPKTLELFSEYEQEVLFSALMKSKSRIHLGILLAMFTGMRVGEICALRWEDIDFRDHVIFVRHTMLRLNVDEGDSKTKVLITAPKSACSIRVIPLPQVIQEKIHAFAEKQDAFVLTGTANQFVEPRSMHNNYRKLLEECGIPFRKFHTLRHTFATRCIELGFDAKTLSEILGHYDIKVTLNTYVHPSMTQKQESMERLSNLFAVR